MDRNRKSVAPPALLFGLVSLLFAAGGPGCTAEVASSDGGGPPDAMTCDAADENVPQDGMTGEDATIDATSDALGGQDATTDATSDALGGQDATSGIDATDTDASDAGDAETDSSLAMDATEEAGACLDSDAGINGIGVPVGTTATASGSYGTSTPYSAIDGNINTGWSAGDYTGWIELTFPQPLMLNGLQLNAGAAPATPETYTITGFQGTNSVALGSWTEDVCACNGTLPPMLFAAGTYDAIEITVEGNSSWVAINEISILTASCSAGDAGSEAGASEAGEESEAGASEAGEEDAGGDDASEESGEETGPLGCLAEGTYSVSYTGTACACISGPQTTNAEAGVWSAQVIETSADNWEVEITTVTASATFPSVGGILPISTVTASGFGTATGIQPDCGPDATSFGGLTFSVDCATGVATITEFCEGTDATSCRAAGGACTSSGGEALTYSATLSGTGTAE